MIPYFSTGTGRHNRSLEASHTSGTLPTSGSWGNCTLRLLASSVPGTVLLCGNGVLSHHADSCENDHGCIRPCAGRWSQQFVHHLGASCHDSIAPRSIRPLPDKPHVHPGGSHSGGHGGGPADAEHFRHVFAEFLQARKSCGETVSDLTFEKFSAKLDKSRAAVMSKHHCSDVRFQVYVKNGRAALKAVPTR